jgi:hypothetical protein
MVTSVCLWHPSPSNNCCRCIASKLTALRSLTVVGRASPSLDGRLSHDGKRSFLHKVPDLAMDVRLKLDKWCIMADVWRMIQSHNGLRNLDLSHLHVAAWDSWSTPPVNDLFRMVPASFRTGTHPALDWSWPSLQLTALTLSGVGISRHHLEPQVIARFKQRHDVLMSCVYPPVD